MKYPWLAVIFSFSTINLLVNCLVAKKSLQEFLLLHLEICIRSLLWSKGLFLCIQETSMQPLVLLYGIISSILSLQRSWDRKLTKYLQKCSTMFAHTNEGVELLKTRNIETSSIPTSFMYTRLMSRSTNMMIFSYNNCLTLLCVYLPFEKNTFVSERLQFVRRRAIYRWIATNCKIGHRCTRHANSKCRRIRWTVKWYTGRSGWLQIVWQW